MFIFVLLNKHTMMVTKIKNGLEELVGKRFNKETLEDALTKLFEYPITLDDVTKEDDELPDYNFLGGFDIKYPNNQHLYGFFDIYFLKMRNEGFSGSNIYVTEVAIEFE